MGGGEEKRLALLKFFFVKILFWIKTQIVPIPHCILIKLCNEPLAKKYINCYDITSKHLQIKV